MLNINSEANLKYDMTFYSHGRLNIWLWRCNEYEFNKDYHAWWKAIRIILKESCSIFTPAQLQEAEKYRKSIEIEYSKFCNIEYNSKMHSLDVEYNPYKLDSLLTELEMFCRVCLKKILFKEGEDAYKAMA